MDWDSWLIVWFDWVVSQVRYEINMVHNLNLNVYDNCSVWENSKITLLTELLTGRWDHIIIPHVIFAF